MLSNTPVIRNGLKQELMHDHETGLKQENVSALIEKYGKNVFTADGENNLWRIITDTIKEPMFIMLLVACALYFILGELNEGILMLVAIGFVAAISAYQETKSSKALQALKKYTQPMVNVIRDGKKNAILSEELVPGDVVLLEEGSRVPADCTIFASNDFSVNESVITGESLPVDKYESAGHNQLFQGTTINSGTCYAQVTATGNLTTLGKLGKSIEAISPSKTQLQKQITHFVKTMAVFGIIIFSLIWLVNYLHSRNLFESLLLGLTIAMAVIPEEIPVAFSSFMALGAFHMAKLGIITRQPLTIENLGAVSVICLDKTGTITENRMEVSTVYDAVTGIAEKPAENAAEKYKVLYYARLASEQQPFDAMEKAIVEAYNNNNSQAEHPAITHEYPLSGTPPMMTHLYEHGERYIVAGKGAPERILRVCKVSGAARDKINVEVNRMASQGLRVLGVCSAIFAGNEYPVLQDDFDWQFEGLLALYDPPRKEVNIEFEKWYDAGIKIKLITGDYKETALHIAKLVGMRIDGPAMTGEQVMNMPKAQLQKAINDCTIFARMFPEAKLKVVEALKSNGEIVAMMGDGVNDGPALKSAHIGIAMGAKGTEIARQASDIILTDDSLQRVTEAIKQGRKIYYNLKKAVRYIISIHVPIILTASLPLLLGWKFPAIFTPIHVIFLELIMGPTCSVFFEREPVEATIMQQVPRARTQSIFTGKELATSIGQGLAITTGILFLYYYFMQQNYSIEYVRAMVFITIILSNIWLTFVNRSFEQSIFKTIRYKNNLVPYIITISIAFLAGICFVPFARQLFQVEQVNWLHLLLCIGVSMLITLWFEGYKILRKK